MLVLLIVVYIRLPPLDLAGSQAGLPSYKRELYKYMTVQFEVLLLRFSFVRGRSYTPLMTKRCTATSTLDAHACGRTSSANTRTQSPISCSKVPFCETQTDVSSASRTPDVFAPDTTLCVVLTHRQNAKIIALKILTLSNPHSRVCSCPRRDDVMRFRSSLFGFWFVLTSPSVLRSVASAISLI